MNTNDAESKIPSDADIAEALALLEAEGDIEADTDVLPECYKQRIAEHWAKILAEDELWTATLDARFTRDEKKEVLSLWALKKSQPDHPKLSRLPAFETKLDGGLRLALRRLRNGYLGEFAPGEREEVNRELELEVSRWGGDATEHWLRLDAAIGQLVEECRRRRHQNVICKSAEKGIIALEIEPLEAARTDGLANFRHEAINYAYTEKDAGGRNLSKHIDADDKFVRNERILAKSSYEKRKRKQEKNGEMEQAGPTISDFGRGVKKSGQGKPPEK